MLLLDGRNTNKTTHVPFYAQVYWTIMSHLLFALKRLAQ